MSIQRLPGDVAVQIKSSATVATLNDAILGLLRNALDAGAPRVTISVDYSRGGCVVEDDGVGISPSEFLPDGGLGKHHYTSKYPWSADVHGRYGRFLASVASLSLLTIVSRCRGHDSQNALTIHNTKLLRRHTPSLPEQHEAIASHGTRIMVRDLFGCMPVRARLRPSSDSVAWARDWDSLIRSSTALLLAWPKDVVVAVRDENSGARRTLRAERSEHGRDDSTRIARILAQADLCEAVDLSSWVSVGASVSGVSVSGCVCLVPVASKRIQFVRIGVEPLSEEHHADTLFDEINKIFAESNFGETVAEEAKNRTAVRGPIDKFAREQRPRKAVDRWPMFSIGIDLDAAVEVDDILDGRRQHLAVITGLIRTMLVELLKRHGFYDDTTTLYGRPDRDRGVESRASSDSTDSASITSPIKKQKTTGLGGSLQSKASDKSRSQPLPSRSRNTQAPNSPFLSWPQTKSARPLNAEPKETEAATGITTQTLEDSEAEKKCNFFVGRPLRQEAGEECSEAPVASIGDWDRNVLTSGEMKISRASLEAAEVVGQVDQKFILIKAPMARGRGTLLGEDENTGDLLVLVDQHAADERCRIEAFLQDYFSPEVANAAAYKRGEANTAALEKPLQFELASHERSLLERTRLQFQSWGVFYDVHAARDEASSDRLLLRVSRLPAGIAARCKQEPRLVIDLIRKEIWERSESDLTPPSGISSSGGEATWISRFRGCPRGILDLLNSRACRSAIKFNDPLTREECVDLLDRLLRCVFPFQCAHGRPSMVPLLNIGSSESLDNSATDEVWW